MGTFTKNITPKISAAVSYNVSSQDTASGVVFTTASDEYAIIQMNYKTIPGIAMNPVNFSLNSNGLVLLQTPDNPGSSYIAPGVIFYIGPGQSVTTSYIFPTAGNYVGITITGVVFKNS